ncbi:hypothetical protein F4777DRAFT_590419 [Nemania sp. FL0916]|nr:hypothetical protein F4777DRAFT_590419 [Nemania sp. FL0916]
MKGRCFPFVLLAVWGALGRLGLARELTSRDGANGSDIPSAQDFVRRGCHTVAVVGDYVYIDGGQVTERVNGSEPAESLAHDVNATWSIDMTEKWTNETVRIRSIPRAAPGLNEQIHWTDPSTNSLYTWGGFASDGSPPPQALWRLAADGSGGGSWTQVRQRDFAGFSKLLSPFGAAFAQMEDVGYALGGAVTQSSDGSVAKGMPGDAVPGLVSYNFETGDWANSTTTAYGGYGTSLGARAEPVPFGPNGLLLFLGGAETQVDATNDSISEVKWDRITLVDPVTQMWHSQTTSGSRPPTIEAHCSVGVAGPNGTYEIFLYGGVSDQLRGTSSDVYVLSLPGFVFFEGPKDAPPRSDHQCVVVGKGRRQMLSMGGVDGENRTFSAPTTADPWTYGLGILDMTELRWADAYDPDAPSYDSPSAVRQWYDAGNLADVQWDSNEVAALFMSSATAPTSPSSNTANPSPRPTGAIVGGAVGGALGAAAVGMISFLLTRRWRRRRAETPDSNPSPNPSSNSRSKMTPTPMSGPTPLPRLIHRSHGAEDEVAEYRPEPCPKDVEGGRYVYSPDSLPGGSGTRSPRPYSPYAEIPGTYGTWPSELPAYQDGIVAVRGGELPGTEPQIGELMDPNMQWAYELPAPLESRRAELPDRKYSR